MFIEQCRIDDYLPYHYNDKNYIYECIEKLYYLNKDIFVKMCTTINFIVQVLQYFSIVFYARHLPI